MNIIESIRRIKKEIFYISLISIGMLFGLTIVVLGGFSDNHLLNLILLVVLSLAMFSVVFLFKKVDIFISPIGNLEEINKGERQQALDRTNKEPNKVKPFWDLAQTKLEEYINVNVKQVQQIYSYSRILMTIGFILIIIGIFLAFSNVSSNAEASGTLQNNGAIIIAIVSSASGVLIEFIGASVLVLYRTTVQQSINYVDKLERMNNVGMAMQILDTVSISTADKPVDQQKIFDAKIRIAHQLLNIAQDMTMSSHTVIESSQPPTSAG
jgi:hypothetical protein